MNNETRLPDKYKSWVDFYRENQHFINGVIGQITEVVISNSADTKAISTKTYSTRYIKKQALQELMNERFTDKELITILHALDQARHTNPSTEPVFNKLLTICKNRQL